MLPPSFLRTVAHSLCLRLCQSTPRLREDVGWTLDDGPALEGREIAWLRVRMRSRVSHGMSAKEAAVAWRQWEEKTRALPSAGVEPGHTCDLWVRMATEQEVSEGLRFGLGVRGEGRAGQAVEGVRKTGIIRVYGVSGRRSREEGGRLEGGGQDDTAGGEGRGSVGCRRSGGERGGSAVPAG